MCCRQECNSYSGAESRQDAHQQFGHAGNLRAAAAFAQGTEYQEVQVGHYPGGPLYDTDYRLQEAESTRPAAHLLAGGGNRTHVVTFRQYDRLQRRRAAPEIVIRGGLYWVIINGIILYLLEFK